ncbi:MAG: mechanosensitive ion channel family protein [Bacteroidetes bacterium]|nr:mechanosensitive ion channel family protein [Bacteroidota bacterium]
MLEKIASLFPPFMQEVYFGNSIAKWIVAVAGILLSILIAKVMFWLLSTIVKKFTAKTKTNLDDLLIEKLEGPVAFAIGLIGVWMSMDVLTLPAGIGKFFTVVFYIATVLNIVWTSTRLIDAIIDEYIVPTEKSESDLDDQILPIVRKALKATVWILAFIIGLSNAGYDVGALIAGLGIGGLAFALAAQDSVKNLFGGITIFTDKPFKIKDRVIASGHDGVIEEIGLRSTRLRTMEGRRVTIPNSVFSNTSIENVSSEPNRKVVTNLALTYASDYAKVEMALATLTEIASTSQNIEKDYSISFNKFMDSALNIEFVYFIKKDKNIPTALTEMNLTILKKFNEKGIDFAFPTRTIFHKALQ